MNHEVFAALGEALSRGEEAALVTIVSSNGSTPQRLNADQARRALRAELMLVDPEHADDFGEPAGA